MIPRRLRRVLSRLVGLRLSGVTHVEVWHHGQAPTPWRVACYECMWWRSTEYVDAALTLGAAHDCDRPDGGWR